MLEQPQAGLIGRFYRQVENRPKNERFHGVTILIIIVHCAGNEVREEDSGRANGGSKKSKDFFH